MMNNNMFQQPTGFGFGGVVPNQTPMPKTGNWLSAENYALLQKSLSQFRLSVTKEELAKGQCNHYNLNGTSALIPDQDGSGACTCSICGTKFNSREYSQEDVTTATQNILDILNTIKIMYLSLDANAALDYFQIIPFIEKIPQLYNIAVNDFKKYEGINNFTPSQQANPFNIFSMMTNPGMMYAAQQNMGAPAAAPGYYGAPAQPGYPNAMGYNPLYGQPMAAAPQGYVPQANGYAMNPMGAAAVNTNMPVQPTAPAAAPASEEVKVDSTFKK